ncbi:MAG: type II toxin-antitoxin system prevent-host-death family antitoxin [Thermomicrobiales bacterium]
MTSVGVRELKEHTSEIVRRVRDNGETIDITYRGEVVATLVPKQKRSQGESDAFWERLDKLRQNLAAQMGPDPIDVVELLNVERMEISPDDEDLPPMRRAIS